MRRPAALLALFLLGLNWGCGEHFSQAPRSGQHFRNDTLRFPEVAYTAIRAFSQDLPLEADGQPKPLLRDARRLAEFVQGPGRELSPAHRADLYVALAIPPDTLLAPTCQQARHAIVFLDQEVPVGAISLNFGCGFYRFEPPSAHRLGPNNLARLQLIFSDRHRMEE